MSTHSSGERLESVHASRGIGAIHLWLVLPELELAAEMAFVSSRNELSAVFVFFTFLGRNHEISSLQEGQGSSHHDAMIVDRCRTITALTAAATCPSSQLLIRSPHELLFCWELEQRRVFGLFPSRASYAANFVDLITSPTALRHAANLEHRFGMHSLPPSTALIT